MPILDADASQIEWRVAMFLSQDEVGIREIKDGVDFHADNAEKYLVTNIPGSTVTEMRTPAKRVGFGLIYGKTPQGFAKDTLFPINSRDVCQEIVDGFYTKYAKLKQKHDEWIEEVNSTGQIVQPTGRVLAFRRFKNYKGIMAYNLAQIKNYPVQSLATADIMPLAIVTINRKIRQFNIPCKFIMQVHDSCIYDVPSSSIKQLGSLCVSVFRDLPNLIEEYFGFKFNVPLDGEVKAGVTWAKCKKIDVQ